jgi:hypothetical protein
MMMSKTYSHKSSKLGMGGREGQDRLSLAKKSGRNVNHTTKMAHLLRQKSEGPYD